MVGTVMTNIYSENSVKSFRETSRVPGKCLLLTLIILENICLLTQDSFSLEHHWKIMMLPLSISCCKVKVVQNYLTRKAAIPWVTNGVFTI